MHSLARRALNLSAIPRDLHSVTFRDTASEHPERVDLAPEVPEAVWRSVEALYRTGVHPGIQLSLRYRGEQVLHRAIGHSRGNGPRDPRSVPRVPIATQTPVCLYSASEAVTAWRMDMLAEQGLVNVMDSVSYFCPAFVSSGKRTITVHQTLSCRGAIPGISRETR